MVLKSKWRVFERQQLRAYPKCDRGKIRVAFKCRAKRWLPLRKLMKLRRNHPVIAHDR